MQSTQQIRTSEPLHTALALLAGAIVAGFLVGDSLLIVLIAIALSFVLLGCWALAIVVYFLWGLAYKKYLPSLWEQIRHNVVLWVTALLIIVTFLGVGHAKSRWRSQQAEKFVARAARQLDAAKAPKAPYPQQLPPDLERDKPSLVSYNSDGQSYSFSYEPPLSLFQNRYYDSQSHRWEDGAWD